MTKEYKIGQIFENFELLAVNAENSQISIAPYGSDEGEYWYFFG